MNKTNNVDISIIVAVRNEEEYISKCMDSLINQHYPHEKYEIIVIDGMSDDKTREILALYRSKFPSLIKIFDNPRKIQASGRNIGIKNARGKVLWMFDGHAYANNQYVSTLARVINECPDNVAGTSSIHMPPDDERFVGKVISDVQMSIFGGAGTTFRKKRGNTVYSVAFHAYRKSILDRIGYYDEKLATAEDLDLNWRINRAGYSLVICQELRTYYYRKHSSLRSLLKHMIKYGIWRAIVSRKHPDSLNILFYIPALLVISCGSLPLFIFVYPLLARLILLGLAIYFIVIFASSLYISAKRKSVKYLIALPVYLIEHFGLGLGFIGGIFKDS